MFLRVMIIKKQQLLSTTYFHRFYYTLKIEAVNRLTLDVGLMFLLTVRVSQII